MDERDGAVDLVVADTGCGISPEDLPHISDRFYRVPDTARTWEKGLGLGLSFVSWIAKEHNAKIAVDSKPGKGTRFTVSFPGHAEPENSAQPVAARSA